MYPMYQKTVQYIRFIEPFLSTLDKLLSITVPNGKGNLTIIAGVCWLGPISVVLHSFFLFMLKYKNCLSVQKF